MCWSHSVFTAAGIMCYRENISAADKYYALDEDWLFKQGHKSTQSSIWWPLTPTSYLSQCRCHRSPTRTQRGQQTEVTDESCHAKRRVFIECGVSGQVYSTQWHPYRTCIMFFSLKEIVKWFGMTAFELWLHLVAVLVFSVLAVLKHEHVLNATWWTVFIPLFTCDGLNAYFCAIVFIRMFQERDYRYAGLRLLSSAFILVLTFVFKILLCQKMSAEYELSFSEVFTPLFILWVLLMIRACQNNWLYVFFSFVIISLAVIYFWYDLICLIAMYYMMIIMISL